MGLEDIKGVEKLESDLEVTDSHNSKYRGTIYALDDFLYLRVSENGSKVDICTNSRSKKAYWSVKKLQEKISDYFKEKNIEFNPVTATEYLKGGHRHDQPGKMDLSLSKN